MRGKLILSVVILLLGAAVDAASGFSLKVDFGNVGQPVKAGWQEFTGNGNDEIDPKTEVYDVDGQSVSVSVRTGVINDSGYRNYGGGDLGGDMVYPDDNYGPVNGRVILTLGNLPAGSYTLVSYHNDTKGSHAQQDPIDVTVGGAVTGSTSDLEVVQTKSPDDANLGSSTVSFAAEGTGDVNVVYTPTTSNGVVSKAALNGFELDSAGAVPSVVEFDSSSSSDFESVSPVALSVVLSLATPNTVTVDYNVTGGTAEAGADYTFSAGTLTFDPNQTTPEYISISIINDGLPEDDETVEVTLSNPVNALLGTKTQHTYTILDPHPRVSFATTASQGRENVSPAHVAVDLSWAWSETVTVDYNVTGGTAEGSGVDYTLEAGTLQFDPCEVTKYIAISIVEDAHHEDPDETIEITLSDPANAKLGTNTAHTFTILPPLISLCPKGDLDGDCDVDANDVRLFCQQWLDPPSSCSGFDCADFDGVNGIDACDYALLAGGWQQAVFPVVINEFMASNDSNLQDPCDGTYPDWIELYNGGPIPLDLGGLHLTDRLDEPTRWEIPADVTIEAGGYLVFLADGETGQGPLHTSFGLKAAEEDVGLFDTDGSTLIDGISYRDQVSDISYGRYPDASDNLRFFATPTPGSENIGAYDGEVADTKFSHDRGFYESSFNLVITCETAGAEIHYTLNGSEPDQSVGDGTYLYVVPINISSTTTIRAAAFKPGYLQSDADAQTYIFLDDVVNQPGMDAGVVAAYSSVIEDAFESVPTLSIAMDACDLANLQLQDSQWPDTGLPKMELPASAELIYADANEGEGFQINCGIEGHSWALDKRSFKLLFKTAFGPSQLRYPFFESATVNAESAVDEFDRIVLRASKNMPVTYVGDQWTRDAQTLMSGIGSRGIFVHLYLNGTYWGMYNPTERPDGSFMASYLGGEKEDYYATNHGYERGEGHISGDPNRFDTMKSMANARNLAADPCNYDTFRGLCDVTNFADYTIIFWFSGFGDSLDNNYYAGMRNVPLVGDVPPEGFMTFMWDAEAVFQVDFVGPDNHEVPWVPPHYFTETCSDSPDGKCTIVATWLALHDNEDFRMLFSDRVYKHCFNDGPLTDENTQELWDAMTADINDASFCELARWPNGGGYNAGPGGDANIAPPDHIDMNGFVDIFMTALNNWGGLYPSIDPPVFNQQGGHVAVGFGLTMTDPCGAEPIYYTLDGSDPRAPVTGNPVGTSYGGTITLNESRHVKARVLKAGEWSALNEAVFAVGPVADSLRITEIMYHPNDTGNPNDPNTEFIELKNIGIDPINLNLVGFTNGIDFTFSDVSLIPGGHVLVVKDQNAFAARYGPVSSIAGQYTGSLRNGGEQIMLEDAIGQVILDFEYRDGWRSITDGNGFSLTIIDAGGDANSWSQKDSWRPSAYLDGSPGWDDAGILPNPGEVVINEVMAHSHDLPDWIELHNTTASAIDIGGWSLSDSDSNLTKYEIAAGTTIDPCSYIVFCEDVNFGDYNDPGCNVAFAFSENGEEVVLSSYRDANGHLTGYHQVEDFGASDSNVSFGRYYKASTDNYNFVAMDHNTPGASNAYPKVGPIVINEIMYHPDWPDMSWYDNESYEYIELRNITASDVNLYDEDSIPWTFTDGIEFTFPAEANIPAQGYMLVVKDPDAFAWLYGSAPPGVEVLGPYDGKLNNGGEKLELSKPGDVDQFGTRYYIRVDRINYSDGFHPDNSPDGVDHWPISADGGGASLNRLSASSYGNDPNNWGANTDSPGTATP